MSCLQGILPIVGFFISFFGFSYVFLHQYVMYNGPLTVGVILVITSSFLTLTFIIIKCLQCRNQRRFKSYGQQKSQKQKKQDQKVQQGLCEQDRKCFMRLWNAGKDIHCGLQVVYYGLLLPVVIFILVGLFIGAVIYFMSDYCIKKKNNLSASNPKSKDIKKKSSSNKNEQSSELQIQKSQK